MQSVFKALSHNCSERLLASSRLSAWNNSAPTARIFTKFYFWVFFENLPRKMFHLNRTRINRPLYIFILSRSFLLRMRNISDKRCGKNQNTHFVFSNFFFFLNLAIYKIIWKNIVERGMAQITIWIMRIACWIRFYACFCLTSWALFIWLQN